MAATGALVGVQCYPSQAAALDAYFSTLAPVQTPGSVTYVNEFVRVSGVWMFRQSSVDGTGAWTVRSLTTAPVVTFPACDPTESFFDGAAIGWGIAAAMVVAFSFKMMEKATS